MDRKRDRAGRRWRWATILALLPASLLYILLFLFGGMTLLAGWILRRWLEGKKRPIPTEERPA